MEAFFALLAICKNIERHTTHTIVSWLNPKQWLMVHTSDLCEEFTGHRWISRTKASDAGFWCFYWSVMHSRYLKPKCMSFIKYYDIKNVLTTDRVEFHRECRRYAWNKILLWVIRDVLTPSVSKSNDCHIVRSFSLAPKWCLVTRPSPLIKCLTIPRWKSSACNLSYNKL